MQKLYDDEKYYLQIDCHMRFCKDWDKILIADLPCQKSIISCYPSGYELGESDPVIDQQPLSMCFSHFSKEDGLPRFKSSLSPTNPFPFWAAGFSFSSGQIIKQCPYENIPHVFFGEEHLQHYKFWLHGFSIISPPHPVCSHLWDRRHVCHSDHTLQSSAV